VIPHAHVIDALPGHAPERRLHLLRTDTYLTDRRKEPDPDAAACNLCGPTWHGQRR